MKPDAAAVGIENRVRQQMIQVDSHRARHNDPCLPPVLFPEQLPEYKRYQQVRRVVDDMPIDVADNFHANSMSLSFSFSFAVRILLRTNSRDFWGQMKILIELHP